MKRADLISGIVLAVFGLMMLAFVIPLQIEQAPPGYVSPRLVPNLAMIFIVGLSVLLIVKSLRKAGEPPLLPDAVFSRSELIALLKISAVFIVALVLFWLGTPLGAGIVLIAGTLVLLGEQPAFDLGFNTRRFVAGDLGAFLQSARHRDRVTGAWNIFLSAFKTF